MKNLDPEQLLSRAIDRASHRPAFLSYVVRQYQEQMRMSEQQLLGFLGCNRESLRTLALSRTPDASKPDFADKVSQIGESTGVSPFALLQMIRQVDSLGAMKDVNSQTMSFGLLAARDKVDEDAGPD